MTLTLHGCEGSDARLAAVAYSHMTGMLAIESVAGIAASQLLGNPG